MGRRKQASALFQQYRDDTVVRKSEDFAKFTIPSLMVDPLCHYGTAEVLEYDFQSAGSLLVNNLTSKLAMSLFPVGRPCFQIKPDLRLQAAANASGVDGSKLQSSLANLEKSATERLFLNASLAKLHRAIRLLIVTGNCLILRQKGKFIVWSVQSYSIRRTADGDPKCLVLKQRMPFDELPIEMQNDAVSKHVRQAGDFSPIDLYTVVEWLETPGGDKRCVVWNEVDDKRVGPESSYPAHLCPWVPVAWSVPDGEHYGRGYVEEYSGDFAKLSLLSEQLGLYELDSLNVLKLVDESAGGVIDDYKEADTGAFVPGKAGAVTTQESGDYNKIAAIQNSLQVVVMRLNRAFMYTGQVRDAERVTQEEIRTVAQEAENLLGGAYSVLAENLQAPLAYLMMGEEALTNPQFLLGLVDKLFRPTIITGIPALTRNAETQNLLRASQEAAAIVPVLAQVSRRFDIEKVVEMIFNNNSVDLDKISKSADQIAAEAQAQAEQAQASLDVAQGAIAATESIPGVLQS